MPIEGFDYQTFANELAAQAGELIPADFQQFQKDYVTNTIKNFATLSADAIANDEKAHFNIDQAMLLTQIIAEWSFHKSIDVIKSGILPDYWDGIMQKLAFTIFEIGKQAISQGSQQDDILKIVEHHVKKAYKEVILELKNKNAIDETICEKALNQSNIDEMMQQMQQEQMEQEAPNTDSMSNSKILKLASLALLLKQVSQNKVQTILNKFDPNDAQTIIQYMQMPDLEDKLDQNITMKCLQEIKTTLPEPKYTNPTKIMEKMNKIFESLPKENLELIIKKERPNVREFILKAKEGEYYQLPSKVANIITQHLEESIS